MTVPRRQAGTFSARRTRRPCIAGFTSDATMDCLVDIRRQRVLIDWREGAQALMVEQQGRGFSEVADSFLISSEWRTL